MNTLSTRESQLTGPWEGSTLALESVRLTVTLPPDPSNPRVEVKEVGEEVLLVLEKEVEEVLLLLEKEVL